MQNLYTSIQKLQQRFDHNDIASIVIGGVAVAVWGEPRVTRDADLKVSFIVKLIPLTMPTSLGG